MTDDLRLKIARELTTIVSLYAAAKVRLGCLIWCGQCPAKVCRLIDHTEGTDS